MCRATAGTPSVPGAGTRALLNFQRERMRCFVFLQVSMEGLKAKTVAIVPKHNSSREAASFRTERLVFLNDVSLRACLAIRWEYSTVPSWTMKVPRGTYQNRSYSTGAYFDLPSALAESGFTTYWLTGTASCGTSLTGPAAKQQSQKIAATIRQLIVTEVTSDAALTGQRLFAHRL